MIDVTKIWDRLFLGNLCDAKRLGKMNHHGLTTALSSSARLPCVSRRGISYVRLHVDDAQAIPIPRFDKIMRSIAENPRRAKLRIYRGSAVSHARFIGAAWMLLVGSESRDKALVEIAELRFVAAPAAMQLPSVTGYLR